ncbi:hypothetical protein ACWATR_01410 [Nostoc sp. UIC 10890]
MSNKIKIIGFSLGLIFAAFVGVINPENGDVSVTVFPAIMQPVKADDKVAIDLDKLTEGQIAHNMPSAMFIGEPNLIKVNLTKDLSADISREFGIDVRVERLKINAYMKVDLIGFNFEIKPLAETNQILANSSIFQWEWNVLPKEVGRNDLTLKVSARLKLPDGSQEIYTLKTIRKPVEVKNSFKHFVRRNWKWLLEIFIYSGIIGMIVAKFPILRNIITRQGNSSN